MVFQKSSTDQQGDWLLIKGSRFHTTYPDSPYGSLDAFDLAYGFSVATELGTGEAGLGTGDGGKDFLPRRFLMFEQELLWSLKQQSNEIVRKNIEKLY